MKILIAGAGIGGLTAALCLQKAGHEVLLFEQAKAFSEVGAGLQCGANVLKVMDWLALFDQIKSHSVVPERVDFRDAKTGKVLYCSEWGETYQEKYRAPYLHIHRADLQTVLVDAFEGQIELGAFVSSYTETRDGVSITLNDGRQFEGDCLIGADGIKSSVRKQLLGDIKPIFTGNVAWRGVVARDKLPENFMQTVATNFMGQGKHMVIYYLRNQELVNFVGVVEGQQWLDESWTSLGSWQELKNEFDGWHPTVQTLIDAANKQQCYRWALFNHRPFKTWSSDRVTLLGDAAHATLPFMASGAAMAIEDARILQRSLDQSANIGDALQRYQQHRIPRTSKVQIDSARFGKLYHISNPLALKFAFKALQSVAKAKESFLPGYNANIVKI